MRLPSETDLLAAVNALGREQPKRPTGKDWQRMSDMAKAAGLGISAMRYRFARALERGLKVERFVGSDYDATGTLAKQTWFRVRK